MIGRLCLIAFMTGAATALAQGSVAAQPRPVSLTASDGVTLKGTLYPASQPGPGVLLLHQCNRDRAVWRALAEPLAAAGLSVLTVDYRGFGESAGPRFADLRGEALAKAQAAWPSDIDLALEHLASQPGVSRDTIGVAGASCGVNNAVQAARRDPRVKSLVLMAGTTDRHGRAFLRTGRRLPALFVLAEDDEFPVSILTTRWLYGLTATAQKQLLVYPTGGHGADMFAPQPDVVRKIVDWFVASLRTTPGGVGVPKSPADTGLDMSLLAALDDPGGPARIAAQLKKRAAPPAAGTFPEGLVNGVGYEYLAGNPAHAVAVFKLNVQAYPASPNAHDSLADGYVATGQKDQARTHAQQALKLLESARDLPDALRQAIRESAETKLKQLGGGAQGITAAGQPAQLDIRVAGERSIRVTLKPLTFTEDFPVNPAIATRAYPAPALRLRESSGPVQRKVGALTVDVRPEPLTVTVTNGAGRLVQRITFAADGTLSFKLDEHPVLGMGEGGPRPQPGTPWRQQAVQFDRRGQLDTMQPRWQADMYGSRNPSAMMLGTSGWGLFVAAPWGQIDLREADRGVYLPWKPTDADRAPQTERNQQQNLAKGLPAPDAVVPGLYDIFIFDAHDPAHAMKDFSVITGPAALPPLWALGYMQSHRTLQDDAQMLGIVKTFREKNIPLDAVIYLGTGFVPRGWNTRQPSFDFNPDVFKRDPKAVIADMHAQHVKVIVHMVPWDRDKLPTLRGTIPAAPGETLDASHIQNYWQQHVPLVKSGIDAFWPDEGDWFNLFERIKRHQLYYQGHLSTTPNVRPWSLQRNGHPGIAQWGGWVWSGDTDSSWKTLEAQVAVGINYSLSIGPYWGSDIGGFYPNSELTGELYARWFQFAAFCGSFRSHGRVWWTRLPWGWGLSDRGPQEYGNNNAPIPPEDRRNILMSEMNNPAIEPIAKKYAELRYQLLPYTYTLAWDARNSGMPLMRAMWLHYPDDPAVRGLGTQFMWGRDLLVAPVFTKGATSRDVYLPKGDWYDWWTNAKSAGGTSVTRAVDLATMPIYVRAGAIIPVDPVRQYTGQPVSEPTTLRIYGGADGEYTLYEDDGISQDYVKAKGTWTRISWNDRTKQLTVQPGAPKGATNVVTKRAFRVTLLPEGTVKDVTYAGVRMQVRF